MKKAMILAVFFCLAVCFAGCGAGKEPADGSNMETGQKAETGFFMIFIWKKKKQPNRQKGIQDYFSLRGIREKNLQYVMQVAVLPTWELCRTAFLMRWNCQRWDITPLH
ncbi:hypothetical protein [Parablautia muri]|uniref:hypothetical protein n=1 Tax=Parablautia muri TaxID=2320879 RepID=UPI002ED47D51